MTIGVSHVVSMHSQYSQRLRKLLFEMCKETIFTAFSVSFLVGPVRTFEDLSFQIIDNDLPLIIIHIKATGFMQFHPDLAFPTCLNSGQQQDGIHPIPSQYDDYFYYCNESKHQPNISYSNFLIFILLYILSLLDFCITTK